MYGLLIVEDEALVRRGIRTLIDYPQLGIEPVWEAADGQAALALVAQHQPDIILTDINMPQVDGLTFAKQVKAQWPDTRIIFLTGYDYFDYAVSALKLGADDYLLKPVTKSDIEALLVQTVARLDQARKQATATAILKRQDSPSSPLAQAIAAHLADPDLSLKSLAQELGFSTNYLSSLIKKELGIAFQDYVHQIRMEQAKILLLTGSYKIYEVAERVGIRDVNYFSVRFKQWTGVSPKQFQREGGRSHAHQTD